MSIGISSQFVIDTTLKVGVIYKFNAPELLSTDVPHHFIIIAIEDETNYLAVCTTQLDAKIQYFKNNGIDLNTLAYLRPNSTNGLKRDTYVNCNDYHTVSRVNLKQKIESNQFEITGDLSLEEYQKIVDAIKLSFTNDIPNFLLKYQSSGK